MYDKVRFWLLTAFLVLLAGCQHTYPITTIDRVKAKVVCGQRQCDPGSVGPPFYYLQTPYAPGVKVGTTPKDVAMQQVGRITAANDLTGKISYQCSDDGSSPFTALEVEEKSALNGMSVVYAKQDKLRIDVNAKVAADLNAMKSLGLPSATLSIEDARVKLTSAYSSLSESEVTYTGRYYTYGLTIAAVDSIFDTSDKAACAALLKQDITYMGNKTQWRLISGVGVIAFDAVMVGNSSAKIVSELEGELKAHGIPFNVSASVERSIKESVSQKLNGAFFIISQNRVGRERDKPKPIAAQ